MEPAENKIVKFVEHKPDTSVVANEYVVEKYNKDGESMDDLLQKYIEKVDRDQSDLRVDIRESEKRNQKRFEESDKRIEERMIRIADMIQQQNQKIDKIDEKMDNISKEVSTGLNEYRKFMWGIAFSIFLAIAAMILTVIIA